MIAVIDASVIIAHLQGEPGGEAFLDAMDEGSAISAVNAAEVAKRMRTNGATDEQIERQMKRLQPLIVAFDYPHLMHYTATLPHARRANLSLADCACIATARHLRLPALTADQAWAEIAGDAGVEVVVVR